MADEGGTRKVFKLAWSARRESLTEISLPLGHWKSLSAGGRKISKTIGLLQSLPTPSLFALRVCLKKSPFPFLFCTYHAIRPTAHVKSVIPEIVCRGLLSPSQTRTNLQMQIKIGTDIICMLKQGSSTNVIHLHKHVWWHILCQVKLQSSPSVYSNLDREISF